jgi:hypothetical protein
MDKATVFTKTAKGITQVNQKSASLSKDLMKVLKLIDGKSNFGQILEKAELDKNVLEKALNTLAKDGFARVFETRKEDLDPFSDTEDDFDFTAPKKLPGSTQRVVAGAALDITELARQQEKQDADRKAKEAALHQSTAQARAQAEARARADAEAKSRQQAEQAAMEQAKRAKEASERARAELDAKMREEEARKRALAEQQARQAAEQKVRDEEEQRRVAELRAKAEKEANERARGELQAKLREEEARNKAAAEKKAREDAVQKAKEEEEGRKLAEIRVKAEREAQALAEARARAEAEAAAMARARAEAEAAAKKQAEGAQQAEAAMKARLKEEIEGRIRQEMEELLRTEVAAETRAEMQKEIMAEARLAAKAELEERMRAERETIAKAELEARTKAEKDAQGRAEMEAKKRAAAGARAQAESEARIRAEEETKKLRAQAEEQARKTKEMEAAAVRARQEADSAAARAKQEAEAAAAKARQEAEARARDAVTAAETRAKAESERARKEAEARARELAEAESRVNAERQAKYEAEARAKLDTEERDKRERAMAATLDAERKAKEEAEARARVEARARETVEADTRAKVQAELETDLAKRAEIEGKAQAAAYMTAKARAEQEEDEKTRADQARRAKEIADVLRTKVEPDAIAPEGGGPVRRRYKRKGNLARNLFFALIGGLVLAIIAVHVIPMRGLATKIEHAMSEWLGDDVSIASATFRLVPSPHLRVENLAVGRALDAKAITGRIYLDLGTIMSDKPSIGSVELDNVTINNEAAKRIIPMWGRPDRKAGAGAISVIKLTNVKLDVKPAPEPFNVTLVFSRDGLMKQANLNSGTAWTLSLKPGEKGLDLDFNARNWSLPIGAPIPIGDVRMKGTLVGSEVVVPEFEGSAMEGQVNGTLRISWAEGVRLESDLSLQKVSAKELMGAFTKDISVTGKLEGNFTFVAEGPNVEQLFASPRAQGKFRVGEGSVSNIDLVAVMQSDSAGARAGVTKFAELTGEFTAANRGASYKQVNLQGGVLRGNGQVDVGNNSSLSGRLSLEIRSQVAQDRGAFAVSGTVARPIVKRGG